MTDIIDKAQHQTELILAQHIKQARITQTSLPSATHCIDCNEPIPLLRQQKVVGCQRCVACQSDFENQKAKKARR